MPRTRHVIESDITRGTGAKDDPYRTAVQYFDVDGTFLAERDSKPPGQTQAQIESALNKLFARFGHHENMTAETLAQELLRYIE